MVKLEVVFLRDKLNIEYEPNRFVNVDVGENHDGSFHFAGVDIRPGETYIDAVCRTAPARQRAMWGLGLKGMYLKVSGSSKEKIEYVAKELNRLANMTDEEYELEMPSREPERFTHDNIVNSILQEDKSELSKTEESFSTIGISLKDKNNNYRSMHDILSDLAQLWSTI